MNMVLDAIKIVLVVWLLAIPGYLWAWFLFEHFQTKGVEFAKALGLMGVAYILWLGSNLGLLRNCVGGIVLAWLVFTGLGLWLSQSGWRRNRDGKRPLFEFVRTRWRYLVGIELLFLLVFGGWVYFKAYNPEIQYTEKPMEIAFLNGIVNSSRFPPQDPWMAGYGISYYYFGYILLNILSLVSGVPTAIIFNLGLALIASLVATEAFAIGYALVRNDPERPGELHHGVLYGLLTACFTGLMGNWEGVLELTYARGVLSPKLVAFFDIKGLASAPITGRWLPDESQWWWFRAARTVHDYAFASGMDQEVITEFPVFSFILGDMHPHLLALPYALMIIGLALSLLHHPGHPMEHQPHPHWRKSWLTLRAAQGHKWIIYGWILGSLVFLNAWDFPIYLGLFILVYALRKRIHGLVLEWRELVLAFGSLVATGVITYLPFYLAFSSQASGFLPNFYNPTRFSQYLLMFGLFALSSLFALIIIYRRIRVHTKTIILSIGLSFLTPALFIVVSYLAGFYIPGLHDFVANTSFPVDLGQIIRFRMNTPGTWLFVGTVLGLFGAYLWKGTSPASERHLVFIASLFLMGFALTYAVEFVFIRDLFANRMNTVFKFYYQAWVMMSIASGYTFYTLWTRGKPLFRITSHILMSVFLLAGLLYPAFAIPAKARHFQDIPALDGERYLRLYDQDEYRVIEWLRQNTKPYAVLVESSGGSYSDSDLISAFSGRPTLLGWDFHEIQWRGADFDEIDKRKSLLETIYHNKNDGQIAAAVKRIGIRYLIIGPREKRLYGISKAKQRMFLRSWKPVFESGEYTIYQWKGD